jgi:hypothetical protein
MVILKFFTKVKMFYFFQKKSLKGTVRINDSSRYPPSVYGYPPKNTSRQDELNSNSRELLGFNSQSLASLASMNMSADNYRTRPLNLSDYDNQYHNRAKKGFEYWTKDKREPENNRPKGKKCLFILKRK